MKENGPDYPYAERMSEEKKLSTFGSLLRYYRRQCSDRLRGGMLTQDRLGELIGVQMGDAGYTGAAISEWERDKSKIHADDRLVLLALLAVLVENGGIKEPVEADNLLAAGNYRRLDDAERRKVFKLEDEPVPEATRATAQVTGDAPSRRARQRILLEKVHNFWVEGVLQNAIRGTPLINITQSDALEQIDHPWDDYLGRELIAGDETGADMIAATFDRADGALLILGKPGSGKTTTLIALADDLINRARADWTEPIPVILDLASWARLPLALPEWVIDELAAKYQIPRRYGRRWLAANELVLLLDGLDSLPLEKRRACIDAINAFRISHGLTGVVVCSRDMEYEEAARLLSLNGAVVLQPLSEVQLEGYLNVGGAALDSLEEALANSADLWEMARNPLMLSIMTAVFTGEDSDMDQMALAVGKASTSLLFDTYVQQMFARRAAHEQYTQQQSEAWLAWLAQKMRDHNQTVFLIEQIQPSWLPDRRWRALYLILAGAVTGLSGGLIMWLLWRTLRYAIPQLPSPVSGTIAAIFGIPSALSEPLVILLGNLGLGLLLGVTFFYLFERRMGEEVDKEDVRRQRWNQTIIAGFAAGILTTTFILLFSDPLLAIAWGVAEGFMYGAAAHFIFGWSYESEVRTVEALSWSWRHAATGAIIGLVLAVVAEIIETLLYGFNGATRTLATLITAGFVLGGLRGRSAQKKHRPNQGVWLSLRNAFVAALVLSLTLASLAWIIRDGAYAWQVGLLAAAVASAIMGASVFVKHFLLRIMLRYQGDVPWRYARFLDYAAHLVLLRKVGNGYIFMHGLLQSYFADKL